MYNFYRLLGLGQYQELNYFLPVRKIVEHCNRKKRREEFISILDNVISFYIKFSIKDCRCMDTAVEVQVIECEIEHSMDFKPVIEIMEECIPYDVILIIRSKGKCIAHFISKTLFYTGSKENVQENTDWIYEEEIDWLLSSDNNEIKDIHEIFDICDNIFMIKEYTSTLDDICLRRLVDMLHIREEVRDKAYLINMLSIIYDSDDLFIIEGYPFVSLGKMQSYFNQMNESFWQHVLIDRRFSSNHRYLIDGFSKESMDTLWEEFILEKERNHYYDISQITDEDP